MHKIVHQEEMSEKHYNTQLIFSSSVGTYWHKSSVRKIIFKICQKNDIPYHTFHSFRHTFGSNLSRVGVPIERVSKMMGHSDVTTTSKYYLHIGKEEELEAVEKISAFSLGVKQPIQVFGCGKYI